MVPGPNGLVLQPRLVKIPQSRLTLNFRVQDRVTIPLKPMVDSIVLVVILLLRLYNVQVSYFLK